MEALNIWRTLLPTADTNAGIWLLHTIAHPAQLALPTHGYGFAGLRPMAWSVLVGRSVRIHPPTKDRS
jgi:hypothetical protein